MGISNYIWRQIDRIAQRRALSLVLVAVLSFSGCWLWSLSRGIPAPFIMDEFSYLLAGDTFAHGRVTNPTHPMWVHFETFYAQQHPTYMSIYPPGQGAFLALGQILFSHPIYGVWISSALMCAAICWMLYAWLSPRWALVGGLIAVLQFGIFTYWSQSYWGGAVAGIGGALVLGALPRIFKMQRIQDVLWLGLGCAVLANSRPLEGFLVAIPVGCLVLPWKIKWEELNLAKFIMKVILPLGLMLLMIIGGIGAYNKAITGDAKVFPHFSYDNTYESVPLFIFQPLHSSPHFDHLPMGKYDEGFLKKHYLFKRSWKGFIKSTQDDTYKLLAFFFGFPLAIPSLAMLVLFFQFRPIAVRFILALGIIFGAYSAISYVEAVHYLSPLTCLAVLLISIGLRGLSFLKFRKARVGLILVIFLILLQGVFNILFTPIQQPRSLGTIIPPTGIHLRMPFTREALKDFLINKGGKYLVIVKYPLSHISFWEWVYNDADIDHAPIVWARDMDEADNASLLGYFKDRQVLYIDVNWCASGIKVPDYDARQ